ncbi:MAG: response regulator [Chitinispirillia bacterium]|nr:response regulator [Chitinispirillia bacterium]
MAYNILIIDDSPTMRTILVKTLGMAEIEIGELYEAGNGQEALDIMDGNWIDIAFADINMPVMNGIEMVNKMAENGQIKTIPVVVISTEGSKTRLQGLMDKGVKGFLRKPISPELFKSVVDKVLAECVSGKS